jgi:hypothetical protein
VWSAKVVGGYGWGNEKVGAGEWEMVGWTHTFEHPTPNTNSPPFETGTPPLPLPPFVHHALRVKLDGEPISQLDFYQPLDTIGGGYVRRFVGAWRTCCECSSVERGLVE